MMGLMMGCVMVCEKQKKEKRGGVEDFKLEIPCGWRTKWWVWGGGDKPLG